jgi:hypothetical protein
MERPNESTVAYYEAAVPADARARKGSMFGHPSAFVNGNMFFGTFAQSVVARVGEERATAVARGGLRIFEPMAGRAWREYVQIDTGALPAGALAELAREALEWTSTLPPKAEKKAAAKKGATGAKTGAKKTAPAKARPAPKKAAAKGKPKRP